MSFKIRNTTTFKQIKEVESKNSYKYSNKSTDSTDSKSSEDKESSEDLPQTSDISYVSRKNINRGRSRNDNPDTF